tara:strand:+ start:981 stop:1466 length:486 start_codon:yes stop_codon:yes gene_type:complete
MAMTEEEQIMGAEIRKTLMDALMGPGSWKNTRTSTVLDSIENKFDENFNPWQYPLGTHFPNRPKVQSEEEQMDQYYSPDEKRRMFQEFWRRTEIGSELGGPPPQQRNMVPIPISRPGEGGNYAPLPPVKPGEEGEMVPMQQGKRFSLGDLIRSFRESEKEF